MKQETSRLATLHETLINMTSSAPADTHSMQRACHQIFKRVAIERCNRLKGGNSIRSFMVFFFNKHLENTQLWRRNLCMKRARCSPEMNAFSRYPFLEFPFNFTLNWTQLLVDLQAYWRMYAFTSPTSDPLMTLYLLSSIIHPILIQLVRATLVLPNIVSTHMVPQT